MLEKKKYIYYVKAKKEKKKKMERGVAYIIYGGCERRKETLPIRMYNRNLGDV